jgi:hypothetical protein
VVLNGLDYLLVHYFFRDSVEDIGSWALQGSKQMHYYIRELHFFQVTAGLTREVGSGCNSSGSYSGSAWFESWLGY